MIWLVRGRVQVERAVERATAFQPCLIIVSAGFDGAAGDEGSVFNGELVRQMPFAGSDATLLAKAKARWPLMMQFAPCRGVRGARWCSQLVEGTSPSDLTKRLLSIQCRGWTSKLKISTGSARRSARRRWRRAVAG